MSTPIKLVANTRTRTDRNHAFIAPDSHVTTGLPGWVDTQGVVLISPQMGAKFLQYLATMTPASSVNSARPGIWRFLYVLSGSVVVEFGKKKTKVDEGGYAWLPPDKPHKITSPKGAQLCLFEKRYSARKEYKVPDPVFGVGFDVKSDAFLGDPDAQMRLLLPNDPRFDVGINLFSFKPGTTLPFVEVHIMEHGLLLLEGAGIYRLDDNWYPIYAGDAIWMGPYCAQWFVAMGKTQSTYLYYKEMHRDPLEEPGR